MKNARKTYPILISKQDTFSEFNGLLLSGLDIPLGVLTREELVDAIMKIAG